VSDSDIAGVSRIDASTNVFRFATTSGVKMDVNVAGPITSRLRNELAVVACWPHSLFDPREPHPHRILDELDDVVEVQQGSLAVV
jgi:hypothetical protein